MKIKNIDVNNISNDDIKNVLYCIDKKEYNRADYLICFGCHIKILLDERLEKLLEVLKSRKIDKIILSGGIGVNGNFNESEYMNDFLLKNGIKEDKIIIENKSTTTEENIINSFNIINSIYDSNEKNIVLVTHEPHLRRILMEIKKNYKHYSLKIYCEYPEHSIVSYYNLIDNEELINSGKNEIKKIIDFINNGIIDDEDI